MPDTDHLANAGNGNALAKVATTTTTLSGRTSGLPIYDIKLSKVKEVVGEQVATVIGSFKKDDLKDAEQGYRQPTDHDDRDGNLPVAPGAGVAYREYYVSPNSLPMPGYVRLVADLHNKRVYITPTHYDVWIQDRAAARDLSVKTPLAATHAGARSPFFRIDLTG